MAQEAAAARILVVEDDVRLLPVLGDVLRAEGYTIRTVSHGDAAIRELSSFAPDVVLLDLEMPGMDGFEFMKWLGEHGVETPVIIASSRDDVDALDIGAAAKLSKPYDLDHLLEAISAVLPPASPPAGDGTST